MASRDDSRRDEPQARLFLHYGDLTDGARLRGVLTKCRPDEGLRRTIDRYRSEIPDEK